MKSKPNSEIATKASGLAFIAIGAAAMFMWRPQSAAPEIAPPTRNFRSLQTQCLNHAARVRVTVEADVNLLQLPEHLSERDLIRQQLNYVRNSLLATHEDITHFSFTAEEPRLKVLRREEIYTDHPTAFRFDAGMIEPASARLRGLIAQKEMAAGFPQRKIRYQAEAEAVLCANTPFSAERTLSFVLPRNPETALWSVPSANWQELTFGQKTQTMNPCASSELADLPQPEFYWYFWNPTQKPPNGPACADLLQSRVTRAQMVLDPVPVDLASAPTILAKTASVVFGWQNTQYIATSELPALAKEARRVLRGESALGLNVGEWRDPSSVMFLETLSQVRARFGEELEFSLRERDQHLEIDLELSNDRVVRLFWGPSDALGQVPPRHYEFLARALRDDDILIYAGHASLGQSLLPQTKHTLSEKSSPRGRQQLLAFLSCYSVNYLSHHDVKNWTTADQVFVLTTASSMSRYTRTAMTILEPVFSGQALDLASVSPTESWSDDQFVVNELHRPIDLAPVAERITQ